jgi:hypothetical protein
MLQKEALQKCLSGVIGAAAALVIAPSLSRASDTVTFGFGASSQDFLDDRQLYGVRSEAWARGSYEASFGDFHLGLTLTADGQRGTVNADGSYVNVNFGNWVVGLGAEDRHWSYSPHTSLILSRNARPIPSIFLKKDTATEFSHPFLSWIGPWEGEVFLGVDGRAAGQDDVRFFGARLAFEPHPGLQFELLRTAQFTGGLRAFGDVLLGDTNEGTTAEANQMAGFGVSYRFNQSRVYLQAIGEDEAGGLPSCWFYMAGIEHQASLGGANTVVNLELVDTRVGPTGNSFCGPNTAYNNGRHPYTSDGVVMGAPIDSEGKSIHLRVRHDLGAYGVDWGLGHYTVNDADTPSHRLSTGRVTGPVAHVGLSAEYEELRIGGRLTYQGFDLDKRDIERGLSVSVFAERRF